MGVNNQLPFVSTKQLTLQTLPSVAALSRIALVSAMALLTLPTTAKAHFFWGNDGFDSDQVIPAPQPERPRVKHVRRAQKPAIIKETTKPKGPLLISISIEEQRLKIYDSNGLYAETPISTGMRGHSTPMGVFSVIGKEKFPLSNIYSGAPMPYMQRITWSGVAMPAGVLPGSPVLLTTSGTTFVPAKGDDANPGSVAPQTPAAKPVKRSGHIAAFISRKEGKIFVRQNFAPLFEAPVT